MILDWHTYLGLFSSAVLVALVYPYIQSILHGETRPNIVSWVGWSFLAGIATAVQFSEGASWPVIIPLLSTINTAIVAIIALRTGYVHFSKNDLLYFALGLLAIILWHATNQPLLALLLVILADLFVSVPTLIKTYHAPQTEPPLLWLIYTLAAILSIVSSTKLDVYNLLFPFYSVAISFTICLLAFQGNFKKSPKA